MKKQMIQKILITMLAISCCAVFIGSTGRVTSTSTDDNNANIGLTIPNITENNNSGYRPLSDDDYFDGNTE